MAEEKKEITEDKRPPKRHLIPNPWIRVPLKTLGWLLIVILLLPVLLYIPPVQTFVKNIACSEVKKATGMDIAIDRFRLKFPLDVSLQGVSVVEASGDTMVKAREVLADIKLLPLLSLDVKVKKLLLSDGYYRFLSPDSSMIMKLRARRVEVDSRSSVSISRSEINLHKASLDGADITLFMDVWKQKPTPEDTTSAPFIIRLDDVRATDTRFAMSMLPTIDTLTLAARDLKIRKGLIDLRKNDISASSLTLDGGDVLYLSPTPEYIKAHPAPVDTLSAPSIPMTVRADSVSVSNLAAIYALKGAKPLPGFDANYIQVSDVDLLMTDFFNRATSLALPIKRLAARERCGLQIVEGEGLVTLDEAGIDLSGLKVRTPYSNVSLIAAIPFALMELKPEAPVKVNATASVGLADVYAFMPSLRKMLDPLPQTSPLNVKIIARGSLADVAIDNLDAAMPGFFSLRAKGRARNALDPKRLVADVEIDGEMVNPTPVLKMAGTSDIHVPPFKISGTAGAAGQAYHADLALHTPEGSALADGHVSLTSESYQAALDVDRFNVAAFMPDLGIGKVSASLKASGAGFNPLKPAAATDISLCVDAIQYNGRQLHDISLQGQLENGDYHVEIDSPNDFANLEAILSGHIADGRYTATGDVRLYRLDLYALGMSPTATSMRAMMTLDADMEPERWLYDADIRLTDAEYITDTDNITLDRPVDLKLEAREKSVMARLEGDRTALFFNSPTDLQKVVEGFSAAASSAMAQIDKRDLDFESLSRLMPPFTLVGNASGAGPLAIALAPSGLTVDTLMLRLSNDSLIAGNIEVRSLVTGSMTLDTITLGLKERGKLIDYKIHMGNRPGSLDEFAQVNLNGYAGSNRLSAYLTQKNIQNQTGYRLGFTAAMADSTVDLHFTPLRATIAYLPWTFNDDNNISYDLVTNRITANLKAQSRESSILLMTEQDEQQREQLHLNLTNIQVEDFLKMSLFAPPIKASVNSDLRVRYTGKALIGKGTLDINRFIYDKTMVGDFNFDLQAGTNLSGKMGGHIGLKIDGKPAMSLSAAFDDNGSGQGLDVKRLKLSLTQFPLKVANPFLGNDVLQLGGGLTGDLQMSGSLSNPLLNGRLATDSVRVTVPMMASTFRLYNESLTVADNILVLHKMQIFGQNANPLILDGSVNAQKLSDIQFDLSANAQNFCAVNNDKRARSDIYGKLFLTLGATVKGPMKHMDVNANLTVLNSTDIFYQLNFDNSAITTTQTDDVVKFVNFSDTTRTAKTDTVPVGLAMRVKANATLQQGMQATVLLSSNGVDRVQVQPSGNLGFYQNYMGDMSLNGQIYTGNGMARYNFPVLGDKSFTFAPDSYILFNGNVMNPAFNITAYDKVKASVVNSSGNSNLVNFLVTVKVTNNLAAPKVNFDLSTDDDLSLQNELQSMSPDQRSTQAMNLLITGRYSGQGMKTDAGPLTGNLYGFLASTLNQWAAKNIRGVDLNFGVDQYDRSRDGQKSTTTSYSYQVSKSLFNNKFKIVVGGNYSTDTNPEDNLAENLFSDVSFEYTLKQTTNLSMLVKLYRHIGYESILEGEVTETGVGFVMRRRLSDLRRLFRVRWGKRRQPAATDSVGEASKSEKSPSDKSGASRRDSL